MNSHTSDNLFTIAAEADIPLTPGAQREMSDEQYEAFEASYLAWSRGRDSALQVHLARTPTLFRVYLPFSPHVLVIASQVVWYLDEIITRDPVIRVLEIKDLPIEDRKVQLRQTIQVLSHFRHPITAGYILLYGSPVVGVLPREPSDAVIRLVDVPEVRDAMWRAAHCGYDRRPDSTGNLVGIYQIALDSGGIFGFGPITVGPHSTVTTPGIRLVERLPRVTPDQLAQILGQDPNPLVTGIFALEAQGALAAAEAARRLHSAVLFDKEHDSIVVSSAGAAVDAPRQAATIQVLNVAAPYLREVPPERLQELREAMPSAFLDFRARLSGIVAQGMAQGVDTVDELKARADREIMPALASLDAAINAEAKRSRVLGYGAPLMTTVGALAGSVVGLDPAGLLTLLSTGGAVSLKAAADFVKTDSKLAGYPFSFLWKARM